MSLLLNETQTIRTSVPVHHRSIQTTITQVEAVVSPDDIVEVVNVDYSFDHDFYSSDDVEWLDNVRYPIFRASLYRKVQYALEAVLRREAFKREISQ